MKNLILGMAAAAAAFVAIPASAQGVHDDWESFNKDGRCWAATAPKESAGNIAGRTAPFLSIQNHPAEGVRGSVIVSAGFAAAGEGEVKLEVDGQAFEALPFGDVAFTASGKPEAELIAAMRRGKELSVTWTDSNGSFATDRYSLIGFVAAKRAIDDRCS